MPEVIEKTGDGDRVGSVSASRYAQIVADLRKMVETVSLIQFAIGDYALQGTVGTRKPSASTLGGWVSGTEPPRETLTQVTGG